MTRRLTPADAVWLRGETARNPMVISGVFWLDGPLDVDRLREVLARRLVDRYPVFRQVARARTPVTLPRWRDVGAFDLDDHIEVVHATDGGIAEVYELCSQQGSRPLHRERPPWHVHVIHGWEADRSVVHVRLHHSIGDGWALMQVLLSLLDPGPDPPQDVAEPASRDRDRLAASAHALVAGAGRALAGTAGLVRRPGRVASGVGTAAEHVTAGARYLLTPPRPPRTVLLGRPEGVKRMAWTPRGIPLNEIKALGRRFDATVNDVLLAALTGVLRRYLAAHDDLVDEALLMAPIALRRPTDTLPRRLDNRLGLLPVLLPVGRDDPRDRLEEVRWRTRALKASSVPVVSFALVSATAFVTPPVARLLHAYHQARSTGVVTSLAGPSAPVYLAGARVDGMIGWGGVLANISLTWSFFTLSGSVFAGLVTDAAVTPQPQRLLDHLAEEWGELRTLIAS